MTKDTTATTATMPWAPGLTELDRRTDDRIIRNTSLFAVRRVIPVDGFTEIRLTHIPYVPPVRRTLRPVLSMMAVETRVVRKFTPPAMAVPNKQ